MTWLDAIGPIVLSAALLIVLGAPLAWAVGARGIAFVALSAATSVASITIAAFACGLLHIPWTVLSPAVLSVVAAGVAVALRRWLRARQVVGLRFEWRSTLGFGLVGAAIGAILIGFTFISSIADPSHQSQSYDAIFHLNAVQWVLDTGDASPLHMTMATPGATVGFYPTIWHAYVAIVVQLTGAPIMVAANAFTLVVGALLWPIGCVFLARVVFGPNRLALVSAGALGAAFGAFPATLMWYGELYPNLLANALLPIAIALSMLALGSNRWSGMTRLAVWLALGWTVLGMTMAHPNALFGWFALTVPLVIHSGVRHLRTRGTVPWRARRTGLVIAAMVLVFAVEAILWTHFGTSDDSWAPSRSLPLAFAHAVLNAPTTLPIAITISVLVLVGVVRTLFVRRLLWVSFAYAICVVLYTVSSGWPAGGLRTLLTGLWFNDAYRLGAMLPILGVPLAVLGLITIIRLFLRALRPIARGRAVDIAVVAVCLVVAVVTTQLSAMPFARAHISGSYAESATSRVVSPDEESMFDAVRRLTPRTAVIAGNPWNGSSLVYAYTGRHALFPHVAGTYPKRYLDLAAGLKSGTAAACSAARALNVHYVLDFGTQYVFAGDRRAARYDGLTDLQNSHAVTLIASRGPARLYEITGCA